MKKTVIAKMRSSLILFVFKVLWGLCFLQSTKCQSFPDWKSDLSLDWTRNIKLSAQCIRYAPTHNAFLCSCKPFAKIELGNVGEWAYVLCAVLVGLKGSFSRSSPTSRSPGRSTAGPIPDPRAGRTGTG